MKHIACLFAAGVFICSLACNSNQSSEATTTDTTVRMDTASTSPPVVAAVVAPENARAAFAAKYPGVINSNWTKQPSDIHPDTNTYQVKFTMEGVDHTAWYDAGGKLVASSVMLDKSKVPIAISTAIGNDYAGYTVESVDEITDNRNQKSFGVNLDKSGETKRVHYSMSGKELRK